MSPPSTGEVGGGERPSLKSPCYPLRHVQTVPIYLGYVQRAVCRIPPLRPAHALVKDWPSQTSRAGLGQSPTPPSLSRIAVPGRTLDALQRSRLAQSLSPAPQHVRLLGPDSANLPRLRATYGPPQSTVRPAHALVKIGPVPVRRTSHPSAGLQPAQRTHPHPTPAGNALTPTRITAPPER